MQLQTPRFHRRVFTACSSPRRVCRRDFDFQKAQRAALVRGVWGRCFSAPFGSERLWWLLGEGAESGASAPRSPALSLSLVSPFGGGCRPCARRFLWCPDTWQDEPLLRRRWNAPRLVRTPSFERESLLRPRTSLLLGRGPREASAAVPPNSLERIRLPPVSFAAAASPLAGALFLRLAFLVGDSLQGLWSCPRGRSAANPPQRGARHGILADEGEFLSCNCLKRLASLADRSCC